MISTVTGFGQIWQCTFLSLSLTHTQTQFFSLFTFIIAGSFSVRIAGGGQPSDRVQEIVATLSPKLYELLEASRDILFSTIWHIII